MQALGLSESDSAEHHRALLVLDNFEHVREAATAVAYFLRRSPGPTLLVTSRIPLHVSMETEYPLDPLPQAAAVELFLDRAQAVHANAGPSAEVEEICRRLDGLPLALELAAARLKLLDPTTLLARLDSRLSLLTRGPSDMPERQQTLEATIAWSYDLLAPGCAGGLPAPLDLRRHLRRRGRRGRRRSRPRGARDPRRREPAQVARRQPLPDARDDPRVRPAAPAGRARRRGCPSRHAQLLPRAGREPRLRTWPAPRQAHGWPGSTPTHGNFRTAFDWLALDAPHLAPRLALSLWRFWLVRGLYDEGQTAIERALRLDPAPAQRAELLYQLGAIVISRGDTAAASKLFQESLDRYRELGGSAARRAA